MRRPIVIVPACSRAIGSHDWHVVQAKYVDAVVAGAGCQPLMLPALGEAIDFDSLLDSCDGVMLTGAESNVDPSLYHQDVHDPALPQDHARDATTMPLIRAALERGLPLLAICRGFQEMNVALGGSLHQAVQEVPGLMDHREREGDTLDDKYGPAHRVRIMNGGLLGNVLQGAREITVNSLHGQGLDRLAHGIAIEAVATDGLVEAFSLPSAAFALAVQWHPEWQAQANPDSMKLFGAFGDACRARQATRGGGA